MKKIIIGNSLEKASMMNLEVGLGLADTLKLHPFVVHGDKLADIDTLGNVFTSLNLEVQDHYVKSLMQANKEALEKQIKQVRENLDDVSYESLSGAPADVLVKEAQEENVALVSLGYNPDKGLVEKFLGGVTESVLHRSDKSVLIVKGVNALKPRKIMIAYDFSHHCNEAIEWMKLFAKNSDATIDIVNIIPCYYEGYHLAHTYSSGLNSVMEKIIDETHQEVTNKLKDLEKSLNLGDKGKVSVIIDKEGSISDRLSQHADANDIDLIIMGSHKRGLIGELFLGSVTSKVIKKSNCSVLVAK
ncbi:MAG: universal stress protein [Bacteriovoracaceae bacterium]|jgi:nucleotide-binding universal stress UspA family protein|nr:universal stress protein [Bacteriovoracaceae bacterium]